MAHAMYCRVADFRKSLETLSRAARRSAKPAPPGLYLNGPQRFHESERKERIPAMHGLDARLRSRRILYVLIRACVQLGSAAYREA